MSNEAVEAAAWARLVWYSGLRPATAAAAATRWLARGRPLSALFAAGDDELRSLDLPLRRLAVLAASPEPPPDLLPALRAAGATLLAVTAADYPPALHRALGFRPPPLLVCRGDLRALQRPMVAIVGNREASPDGLRYATKLAGWLARARINVVSGDARGIDRAAQAGAAARGGLATGVLPCGLLAWEGNPDLRLVLSSYFPHAPVAAHRALERNGLVAALSRCLVVVEARAQGGTLNAAQQALHQGRAVYVRATPDSPGAALLLARGARPLAGDPLLASEEVMQGFAEAAGGTSEQAVLPGFDPA
ncbi:MAG: DNA-processing protein DprA [Fimbriimonadaceae bacterium]|nr:DNA-processing protein DprA [Fimbriimonadaceae bacterium]